MISAIGSSGYLEYLEQVRQRVAESIAVSSASAADAAGISELLRESTAAIASAGAGSLISNQDILLSMLEASAVLAGLAQQMKLETLNRDLIALLPPLPERAFDTADRDQDGLVSLDELTATIGDDVADKLLEKIDTDGDGLISRTEATAFRDDMKEKIRQFTAESTELMEFGRQNSAFLIKIFTETMKTQSAASLWSSGSLGSLFA